MKISLPEKVKFIIDEIYDEGYEAFIVGGCVRDSIIGVKPHDYDITTNAKPDDIKRIFNEFKIIDNGIKHGTVGVIIEKEVYEITTYRIEDEYEKNRRPKNVEFTSDIVKDLKRRDFTINAIAYNDRVGIVDKFNGLDDIESKIVKTVGNPDERFSEDGLRIIRAIRFSSKLGFRIEDKTLHSIYRNAEIIKNISRERITDEITKIVMSNSPMKFILLIEADILKNIGVYKYKNKDIDEIEKKISILKKCDCDVAQRLAMLEYILSFNEINNCNKEERSKYYVKNIMNMNLVNSLVYPKKVVHEVDKLIEYMYKDIDCDNLQIKYILGEIGSKLLKKVLKLKKCIIIIV
ncbi:MAG: CCA tRNA nucleotidyltransferase [Romboutsia sp.]|uniref:CCA tRNA nucleotidyltransferase n=1 Tax=Romboutsia sp. TaxID=1965302 RepID=UPI003F395C66